MLRAVIYARFSSDNQREESIDAQVRICTEYCKHRGYLLNNVYADEAKSGRFVTKREAYNQMMVDAMEKKFDIIIFHKLDRNARNEFNYYSFQNTLNQLGIRYEYAVQPIDDSPEGKMMESMLVGMAAYYSRNLANEVKKGLNENAYKALFNGGRPPFGFKIENQKYVIDPFEAEGVRMIFRMFLSNHSYAEIANALAEKGYQTKEGKNFSKSSMYDILRNEKYIGTYIFNKALTGKNGKRNTHPVDNENIIRLENAIPAIISKEDFYAVNKKRLSNVHTGPKYAAKEKYILTGKITCGLCGGPMSGHRVYGRARKDGSKKKFIYYKCTTNIRTNVGSCQQKSIKRDWLEDIVLNAISEKIFSSKAMDTITKNMTDVFSTISKKSKNQIEELLTAKRMAERKLNNLYDLVENGVADEYDKERLMSAKKELATIKEKLETANNMSRIPTLSQEEIVDTLSMLKENVYIKKDYESRRTLIDLFVEKVIIFENQVSIQLTTEMIYTRMVETSGIEPLTPCLQGRCSPS